MKKNTIALVMVGLLVIAAIPFATAATSSNGNMLLKLIIDDLEKVFDDIENLQQQTSSISTLQQQIDLLRNQRKRWALVEHFTHNDKTCEDNVEIGKTGWCPDGLRTNFNIPEPIYSQESVVSIQVSKYNGNTNKIRMNSCVLDGISFDSDEIPYLEISCPIAPADDSLLTYTLANRKNSMNVV
jgi:hypothetical protein